MPVLDNARHERFAQELAKGKSQVDAYGLAGYEPIEANASRLIRNDKVAARLAELQAETARDTVITAQDIVRQLAEDRKFARELEAPGAAISATMGQAKVLGHLSDKVEHTGANGGPIEITDDKDLARLIVFELTKASRDPTTVN